MQTAVAIKETHKPLPHHVRAKSGGARNPAPIVVPPEPTDPEPSEALINQVHFFWELRGDAAKLSTSIVRAIRKERKGDGSIDRLFKDTLNSLKQEVAANKLLRAKQRELPDNQKHDYPSIAIGWVGTSEYRCTSASDIVSTFDEGIEKAASCGNLERVAHLKQQKIAKLQSLANETSAIMTSQKATGLWDLRVQADGRKSATYTLSYEACHARLQTPEDCAKASRFIFRMATLANSDYESSLSTHHIAALARRIDICLRTTRAK